jgi:hypothetical protein
MSARAGTSHSIPRIKELSMNGRFLPSAAIFAATAVAFFAFAACDGAVLPVVENNPTDTDSGKSTMANDSGGESSDATTDADAASTDADSTDATHGDGGTSGCNPSCKADEICVSDQVVGGAFLPPDDAGACPPGRHVVGNHCENDPTYSCSKAPTGCVGAIDCTCAATLCTSQNSCPYQCQSASTEQVNCVCPVP